MNYQVTVNIPGCTNPPSTEPVADWVVKTGQIDGFNFYESDYIETAFLTVGTANDFQYDADNFPTGVEIDDADTQVG
jgi:hypothetical protein